jgi:predicted nucleotidyltransferase
MYPQTLSMSDDQTTLETFVRRLAMNNSVIGILLMGSTGTENLTPTSDYDVLVAFDSLPVPLRIIQTWVDGRLTEVYCTTLDALKKIVGSETPWLAESEQGVVVEWLRTYRIVHDPRGHMQALQADARAAPPPLPPNDQQVYHAWRKIGYNVAHMRRYLASTDLLTQEVVDWRMLYSLFEVLAGYFTVRRLPWRGEKAALRYLEAHDPAYLAQVRACLTEVDRARKVERYADLARLTLAPVGELWTEGTTIVALGANYGSSAEAPPGTVDQSLIFWQSLIE